MKNDSQFKCVDWVYTLSVRSGTGTHKTQNGAPHYSGDDNLEDQY